jgi:hypothetical protein
MYSPRLPLRTELNYVAPSMVEYSLKKYLSKFQESFESHGLIFSSNDVTGLRLEREVSITGSHLINFQKDLGFEDRDHYSAGFWLPRKVLQIRDSEGLAQGSQYAERKAVERVADSVGHSSVGKLLQFRCTNGVTDYLYRTRTTLIVYDQEALELSTSILGNSLTEVVGLLPGEFPQNVAPFVSKLIQRFQDGRF